MFQFSVFFEDHGFETDEYCDEQGMLNVFTSIKIKKYSITFLRYSSYLNNLACI